MKTKTKRRICAVVSALGFLVTLGIAGSVEHGLMPVGRGTVLMVAGIVVFAAAAHKGGYTRR